MHQLKNNGFLQEKLLEELSVQITGLRLLERELNTCTYFLLLSLAVAAAEATSDCGRPSDWRRPHTISKDGNKLFIRKRMSKKAHKNHRNWNFFAMVFPDRNDFCTSNKNLILSVASLRQEWQYVFLINHLGDCAGNFRRHNATVHCYCGKRYLTILFVSLIEYRVLQMVFIKKDSCLQLSDFTK